MLKKWQYIKIPLPSKYPWKSHINGHSEIHIIFVHCLSFSDRGLFFFDSSQAFLFVQRFYRPGGNVTTAIFMNL